MRIENIPLHESNVSALTVLLGRTATIVFLIYTIWFWPIVTVFGLTFGIKWLLDGHVYYFVPLLAASVGLFFLVFTVVWMLMQTS